MSTVWKLRYLLAAVLLITVVAPPASAAFLNPFGYVGAEVQIDPDDAGILAGQDILTAYHQYDVNTGMHYFRIDLEAQPTMMSFAGVYGIAIDTLPGGGVGDSDKYSPTGVTGIDYMLDAHYDADLTLYLVTSHYHVYQSGVDAYNSADIDTVGGVFQQIDNTGGVTGTLLVMEWAIPDSLIGNPAGGEFNWWGYTLDTGAETGMYDVTPEPTVAVLLTAGAGALLRRRKR